MSPVKPVIKSFLIADTVIREADTNKWSAIGIFSAVFSRNFPAIHPSLGLYVRLADAEGDYNIRVEFCDASDRKLAMFEGIQLKVPHKLVDVELGIQTKNLPIPAPGKYLLNLYFNDELIQNIRVDAIKVQ